MANEGKRLALRLKKLHQKNPRCHWCRCVTRLVEREGGPAPLDAATIDHLISRYNLARLEQTGEERTVLACWECNNRRSREETAAIVKPLRTQAAQTRHGKLREGKYRVERVPNRNAITVFSLGKNVPLLTVLNPTRNSLSRAIAQFNVDPGGNRPGGIARQAATR